MQTTGLAYPQARPAPARTAVARLLAPIRRALDAMAAAEAHRRDAAILAAMPDHLLYDIGLTRDGVPSLARQLRATPPR